MPESNTLELGAQLYTKDIVRYKDLSEIEDEGFALSPFAYPENYAFNRYDYSYFIKSEYCLKFDINDNIVSPEIIESIRCNFNGVPEYTNKIIPNVDIHDKDSYIKRCRKYIKEAKYGNIEKCILSRVIFKEELSIDVAGKLFINLIKQNPMAMVSLVYIPGELCWITASPEQLIKVKDGFVHTMSVAGTRETAQNNDQNIASLGEKEIIEQSLVSQYIDNKLKITGITDYSKSETVTLKAGLVEHLCTFYKIKSQDQYEIGHFLSEINPTPAVCGMPLESAFSLICDTEGYDREFYAGYLGKISSSFDMNLFVNLRCASLCSDGGYVYVGGGITADSDPESEWLETELKAKTILKALANE